MSGSEQSQQPMIEQVAIAGEGRSIENPSVSLQDPDTFRHYLGGGSGADTGERIGVQQALTYGPVLRAVRMISGDVSKLPLDVFQREAAHEQHRTIDRSHPAWPLIHISGKANESISALKLWRRLMAHALLWDNGYVLIDRGPSGRVRGLYNLLPDRTCMEEIGGRLYCLSEIDGKLWPFDADDVLHVEGPTINNLQAPELVKNMRQNIAVALAARKFKSKFFANGMNAGGILQAPPGKGGEGAEKIEKALDEKHKSLDKAFRTLVLRDGYKWHATQIDPKTAQMIEVDENEVRHVAHFFNLTPDRLGIEGSSSYNSLEQRKADYHDTTLSYWLLGIKSECNCKLLTERERESRSHFIDYNINALLWTDAASRNAIAVAGINAGRFSPDETRAWENLPPRADGLGGRYLQPLNMKLAGDEEPDEEITDITETPADTSTDPPATEPEPEDTRTLCPPSLSVSPSPAHQAHRDLLRAGLTRIVRRLAHHARRTHAKGQLANYLDSMAAEHLATCRSMIAPELAACAAVLGRDCGDLASELLTTFRAEVIIGSALSDVPFEAMVTSLESSLPDRFTTQTFTAK